MVTEITQTDATVAASVDSGGGRHEGARTGEETAGAASLVHENSAIELRLRFGR